MIIQSIVFLLLVLNLQLILLCQSFHVEKLNLKRQKIVCLNLFNFNNNNKNNDEKEKQFQIQQEILKRRKNKNQMKEYFESVDKKREEVTKETRKTLWSKTKDGIDPLQEWKNAKADGKIKDIGYEAEPPKSSSLFGINVIIPINPIGIPKYDAGERFDIRLPYAERGYEDPDADVLGKIASGFSSLFGKGKKDSKDNGQSNKSTKK